MEAGQQGDLVGRLREALASVPEVAFAYLFGSRARGQARPDSDVDVAIMLGPPAAALDVHDRIRYLAPRLAPETGLDLDLVFLDRADVVLTHRVLRDGVLIADKDPSWRVRHYVRAVGEYLDTAHLRAVQDRATIQRAREGGNVGRSRDPRAALARLGRA